MSIILAALAAGAAPSVDDVLGQWRTQTRNGIVEITRCGNSICGVLVNSDGIRADPQIRDEKNKDASLRTRRLRGLKILENFRWRSAAWSGGTIYNAEDGGTYDATMTLADKDHLRLKGCIVWPLCKTQTWVRVR